MTIMETKRFEKIIQITNDIEILAKEFKLTTQQAQSKVLTMSIRNQISKNKAKALLKDSKAIRFIDMDHESGLSKPFIITNEKVKTITN